jgi:ribonuclease R
VGEHTRKTYQLGDAVRVQVARVDLDDRKIDLEIVGEVTPGAGRRGNKKSIRNRSKTTEGAPSRRSKSGGKASGKGGKKSSKSSASSNSTSPKKGSKSSGSSKKASKSKGASKRRGRDS